MTNGKRIVLDTSTIVSALLFRQSIPRQAFDKAHVQGTILQSTDTLAELNDVLRRDKFNKYLSEHERLEFLAALLRESVLINVTTSITDCRDPKDNKFLALAIDGRVNCIVSSDDDLLVLNPFRSIPIIKPAPFLDWTD